MTAMRTTRSTRSTRSVRGALIALFTGAGLVLTPMVAQAEAPGGPSVAAPAAPIVAASAGAQRVVNTAMAQRGKAYVWAGAGPNGYDCSGLSQFAYRAAGVGLPHSSGAQSRMGAPVSRADLRPGDLVFFYSPVGHVGVYIGNGLMVHAPTSGDVVKITKLDAMGGYHSARRFF